MAIKTNINIQSDDRAIDSTQSSTGQLIQELIQNPLSKVSIVSNIVINQFQSNIITHKLGAKPRGWLIIRKTTNSIVWEDTVTNVDPSNVIIMNSDLSDVIDILVF